MKLCAITNKMDTHEQTSMNLLVWIIIMESVDSICRDSADTQYMPIQTNFSKSSKHLTYKPL